MCMSIIMTKYRLHIYTKISILPTNIIYPEIIQKECDFLPTLQSEHKNLADE